MTFDPATPVAPTKSAAALATITTDIPLGDGKFSSLGGTPAEPQVSIDPKNPAQIVVSDQNTSAVSTDGGFTFQPTQFFSVAGGAGDTSTVYDVSGNLFWSNLGGNNVYITQINPLTGSLGSTNTVNTAPVENPLSASPYQDLDDKEFLAADANGNLFAAWSRQTSTGWQVMLSRSSDQGATWPTTVTVSASSEGYVWPAYVSVASGHVYVAYHSEPSGTTTGQVFVAGYSNDLTLQISKTNAFAQGDAVRRSSYPTETFPPSPSGNGGSQGAAGPWVLADPTRPGHVYVFSINDPNPGSSTLDPADLVFARSTDYGQTWTTSTLEAGPNNSFQLYPTAAIDKGRELNNLPRLTTEIAVNHGINGTYGVHSCGKLFNSRP